MKKDDLKQYVHNGKTITIIPAKRVKKTEGTAEEGGEAKEKKAKTTAEKKPRKTKTVEEKAPVKFSVGDKVALKNVPSHYSAAGFTHSVVIKVFKSTLEDNYRYSIRSSSGQELPLVKAEDLKPRR